MPPRAFYGFPLALSDAIRILKETGYLKRAAFLTDVSNKEAFLEEHMATLFVDNYIKVPHESLEPNNAIPTFFPDTLVDDKEITPLATHGDLGYFFHPPFSWERRE